MNNDFKRFMLKLILWAACTVIGFVLWIMTGMFIIGSQHEDGYCASLIDKAARLESINDPKIILVGNSNLSFGMDSRRVQEALNMPVVNLGLHGGLGNAFHEDIAKLNINSGDIVKLLLL